MDFTIFGLQVFPPKQDDELTVSLTELAVGEDSAVRTLAQNGDVSGATNLANAVLSSIEQVESVVEMRKEDKKQV